MASQVLAGLRILVVEDEYYLADDARIMLGDVGAEVLGPVPTAGEAQALIDSTERIDCVLLDINLRGELAFHVADSLRARAIPFAFVTGYDRSTLPPRFADAAMLAKPVHAEELVSMFEQVTAATQRTS